MSENYDAIAFAKEYGIMILVLVETPTADIVWQVGVLREAGELVNRGSEQLLTHLSPVFRDLLPALPL